MRVKSDAVNHGINSENVAYQDQRYVKCSRCGFVCHLDREVRDHYGSRQGNGLSLPSTTLSSDVTLGATTVSVAATTGFSSSGYIYIYSNSFMNKVTYTGKTSSSFTGCSNVTAHSSGDTIRGEQTVGSGCPFCGTLTYDEPEQRTKGG